MSTRKKDTKTKNEEARLQQMFIRIQEHRKKLYGRCWSSDHFSEVKDPHQTYIIALDEALHDVQTWKEWGLKKQQEVEKIQAELNGMKRVLKVFEDNKPSNPYMSFYTR